MDKQQFMDYVCDQVVEILGEEHLIHRHPQRRTSDYGDNAGVGIAFEISMRYGNGSIRWGVQCSISAPAELEKLGPEYLADLSQIFGYVCFHDGLQQTVNADRIVTQDFDTVLSHSADRGLPARLQDTAKGKPLEEVVPQLLNLYKVV